MHIETSAQTVVQLLIKGDDYEILCPNDEDTWYNLEEVMESPLEWVEDDIDDYPELQAEQDEAILWNL